MIFLVFADSVRFFGGINQWDRSFNYLPPELIKEIETYWNPKVAGDRFDENSDKEKFYILSMFPYPSGSLHLGHVRVYSIGDVLARFFRMRGKNVLHPMGWDAFGLPAENAAIERSIDPEEWTQKNIAAMKATMEEMNLSFDWDREFATCDSDYYKWTQFLFLKLYESGLVYRKEAVVNWDPVDQTVLANEQVDSSNRSWRSGALVEKKMLKQWFVRTTRFATSLREGLQDPILKNWYDIVAIQKNWIGEVNGTTIDFEIVDEVPSEERKSIPIWLKRPEYIDSGKFVTVKPNSYWTFGCNVEGLLPYKLRNPFTSELLPVFVSEAVRYPAGTDVRLGIPELSDADKDFANSAKIPFSKSLQSSATEEELKILRAKICEEAIERGIGGYPVSSQLKDWLISRQRYWGTPIPIIYCKSCGEVPVPETDLPVRLPKIASIKIGKNPLKEKKDWLRVSCPKCGSEAERETDTMDTFVDSSWYFLRFLDPNNERAAFDADKIRKMMPVDLYIGGKEHALLHLYFARFMNHFLHSVNLVPEREPFRKLLCQGQVRGRTYRKQETGEAVKPEFVDFREGKYYHKGTGETLLMEWDKMSKSKHNGVEPKALTDKYGVDTTRLVILNEASPFSHLNWDEKSFEDILSWQYRLWLTVKGFIDLRSKNSAKPEETPEYKKHDFYMFDSRNFYLKKITFLLEDKFNIAAAIAKMQGLTGALRKVSPEVVTFSVNFERALAFQLIALAPVAPCFASELWAGFAKAPNRLCTTGEIAWDRPVIAQPWPTVDENYTMRSEEVMGMLKLSVQKTKEERKLEKAAGKRTAGTNKMDRDGDGAEGESVPRRKVTKKDNV